VTGLPDGLDVLIPPDELRERVAALGAELREEYADRRPVLVSVLKGATFFLADLVRACPIDCEVDFMSISSYGTAKASSGVVRIEQDLSSSIEGRDVLVVEDIIDTGLTLNYLLRVLRSRGPASVDVCCLLDKQVRRLVDLPVGRVGFEIPDTFVIGYGLDHAGLYRNLDAVYAVRDTGPLDDDPACFVPALYGPSGHRA